MGTSSSVNRPQFDKSEVQEKERARASPDQKSPSPRAGLAAFASATEVDGTVYGELMRAALVKLWQNKDHVNRINVFPVPDSDTGTNMYLAMRGGVKALDKTKSFESIVTATDVFAEGCLLSAQGNSGTCLTFLFGQISRSIEALGKESVPLSDFLAVLKEAGSKMNEAMHDPVPGTFLSVVKESVAATENAESLQSLVNEWLQKADIALKRTPEELVVGGVQVLKKRNVVDSGAQGFVFLLEGMKEALQDKDFVYGNYNAVGELSFAASADDAFEVVDPHDGVSEEQLLANRYCTEVIFRRKPSSSKESISEKLQQLGDSIAVVEVGSLIKLHLHANNPEKVFASMKACAANNTLVKVKAEDMSLQVRNSKLKLPDISNGTVGVVWSSMFDIPNYLRPVALEWMAPVRLVVDGESYNCRTEMTEISMANITRLQDFDTFSTGGPSPLTFKNLIQKAFDRGLKEVLLILPPTHLSAGTYNAGESAVANFDDETRVNIKIWTCCYGMCIGGDAVACAFEMAAKGHESSTIMDALTARQNKIQFVQTQHSIQGLLRSGRVPVARLSDRLKIPFAIALELKVVAWFCWPPSEFSKHSEIVKRQAAADDATLTAPIKAGIRINWSQAFTFMKKLLLGKIPRGSRVDVMVMTACNEWIAQPMVDKLHEMYDVRFFDFATMSAALIGACWWRSVGVFVRPVDEGDIGYGGIE